MSTVVSNAPPRVLNIGHQKSMPPSPDTERRIDFQRDAVHETKSVWIYIPPRWIIYGHNQALL